MAAGGERGCTEEGEEMRLRNANTGRISYAECRVGGHKSPLSYLFYSVLPSFPHFHFLLSLPGDSLDRQHWGEEGKDFFIRDR